MHKTRSKPQLPPEFQHNQELTSPDESPILMEVRQTLGNLTTALVTMATKVEQLSLGQASQASSFSTQPGTRAGGNPTDTSSHIALMSTQPGSRAGGNTTATAGASMDLHTEQHIRDMVEHRVRTANVPALAITDDEADSEEKVRPQAHRGAARTSGKL